MRFQVNRAAPLDFAGHALCISADIASVWRCWQDFTAEAPNRGWLADITYIPTAEGWLHLAAVMDLFSRKIVGWAIRDRMQVELASAALTMAIQQQRPQAGLIHHSDRGVQYASHAYRKGKIKPILPEPRDAP